MFAGEYNGKQRHAEDVQAVLRRARAVGVTRSIITAGNLEESVKSLNYVILAPPSSEKGFEDGTDSSNDNGLYSTVGVHPTRCNEFAEKGAQIVVDQLDALLLEGRRAGKVVAVGECGLDYDRLHFCDKEQQMAGFLLQLDIAERHQLPMFLHDRNTGGDFLSVLREHRARIRGGVVHSFTGSLEEMQAYTELGLYIGINGCSLKTEENLRVAREVPLERLLLETDAPWCGIKNTHASKALVKTEFACKKKEKYELGWLVKDRAEPCMMLQIVEVMAALKEMDPKELAAAVLHNTNELFFPTDGV